MAETSAPLSEAAETDAPIATTASEYPPFPPYCTATAPPSVAETIGAGRDLRRKFKFLPQRPARPPPRPAKPRGPKATDVKLSKYQYRAHARCLRRHGAVLTDRLEHMSKPTRRNMIYLWREHADILTPDAIGRIRAMLDADEPFKPEQAYEYFVNLRKTKRKRNKKLRREGKRDLLAICDDKRFLWARNATVAFARGIQQRLARPGRYALADGMLCLSNLILDDICSYMRMKTPSRNSTSRKGKFMMEMSDKIAVWIDEILTESDDRMLMMDFDEDEDVIAADAAGDTRFTDDFLEMMQKGQDQPLKQTPAYTQFTGDMLEVFTILTNAMYKVGDEILIDHGKFHQTYTDAANLLKETPTFDVLEINTGVAKKINSALSSLAKPLTPKNLEVPMGAMIDLCSNFLAENAENNKDKGPAFKLLISALRKQPKQVLFEKDRIKETYEDAATDLTQARNLESDHDDANLTVKIQEGLRKVAKETPQDMQTDMKETIDLCSKYLSQGTIDKLERGPAFDLIIKELRFNGSKPFTPQFPDLQINFAVAHVLTKAPGLSSISPNPATKPLFDQALHKVVDLVTPKTLKQEMNEVIRRCANYLSGYIRDREQALKLLVETMQKVPSKELVKRADYAMNYFTAAEEAEKSPILVPYLPVKDIATEIKEKLAKDVKTHTPAKLHVPMQVLVRDVADVLSQPIAMKSGAAGEKYPMDYLIAVKKSMGTKPMYDYKGYSETYAGAAKSLQTTPVLDETIQNKELEKEIYNELKTTLPPKLTPLINKEIDAPVTAAASKLAKIGTVKGMAFEHLTTAMKEKGEEQLVKKKQYEESYVAGGQRLIDAPNLATKKVDEVAYENVKEKLSKLVEDKPPPEIAKQHMQAIIDESSKYLTAPIEDEHDKRRFLADLMASKQDEVLAQEKAYKITYKEGGQEILDAPATPSKPLDPQLKTDLQEKIGSLVTQKGLQDILKGTIADAAINLTNIVKGRGEIISIIHDDMKDEAKKPFLSVGKFNKTHDEAAEMIKSAPHFSSSNFAPKIHRKVTDRINELPMKGVSEEAKPHVPHAVDTVSKYIAGVATKECGLDHNQLEELDVSEADKRRRSSSLQSKLPSQPTLPSQPQLPSSPEQSPPVQSPPVQSPPIQSQEQLQAQQQQQKHLEQQGLDEPPKPIEIRSFQKKEPKKPEKQTKATDVDMDHEQAVQILQRKLKGRGAEIFYKQPHNELTYEMAADWIAEPTLTTDKSVQESSDTGRLQKKFERKLSTLVSTDTPPELKDSMQDVIIETSRNLSEKFMSKSYKVLAREAVISEMQNRGNEILADVNQDTESYFYSAQRLKKNKNIEANAPREIIQEQLSQKLGEMIKGRGTPRKVAPYIKEYVQTTTGYLSEHVTIPDKEIEAYIALLTEAEVAGDTPLVTGKINKTHAEAVAYWRKLTTFDDDINRPDATMQSFIESKLKKVMHDVTPTGYDKTDLNNVIRRNAGLLTSYVKLQEEKSEALKILVEQMDKEKDAVLLRHGTLRKTHLDGANLLRTKTADQLSVTNVDPVVSRKIQIKLKILANKSFATNKYKDLMDDVVDDVTNYLAVYFLQPEVIQVCKCMKNVIVQCELWCEGSLRRIGRVCSRRSRHVSIQDVPDVCAGRAVQLGPCGPRIAGSGVDISIRQCPVKHATSSQTCPASKPSPGCGSNFTAGYVLYPSPGGPFDNIPTKLSASECSEELTMLTAESDVFSSNYNKSSKEIPYSDYAESRQGFKSPPTFETKTVPNIRSLHIFGSTPTVIVARETNSSVASRSKIHPQSSWTTQTRNIYSSRTPIVTTDQMTDWHSMMVSIMWNIQAWKTWIHNSIKKILTFQENNDLELDKTWIHFQRTTTTEILQWTQYKSFSRQLIIRIGSKYKNKKVVSPTRTTVKTINFIETHNEMLDLIEMFNRWTHWLTDAIKETDLLRQFKNSSSERWRILKDRVKEHLKEWEQCNERLCSPWELRFKKQLSEWVPGWRQPGPVWVISACGAVPSAAVSAGVCDGEDTWVARTTHNCKILPAALCPSMHCCVLYYGGRIYHYTKYQVLCNACVVWLACRAGPVPARAVRVGAVYVGRVRYRSSYLLGAVKPPRYRCHVVMFGRPVAFDCFEMLLMDKHT